MAALAASYKDLAIVLLVLFSTVPPNLQQSAATRAAGDVAVVSHSHAAAGAGARIHPTGMFSNFICFPFLPKALLKLCHSLLDPLDPTPSRPATCRPSLKKKLVPSCTGFLTNASVPEPPKACCKGVRALFANSTVQLCLCHVANGNVGRILPAPLIESRTTALLSECRFDSDEEADEFADLCKEAEDYGILPPMDKKKPSPPPPPPGDDDPEKRA